MKPPTARQRRAQDLNERRIRVGALLRSLSTSLQDVRSAFAQAHHMNPTDVRALAAVMEADRAGVSIGPSSLADTLHISTASTTALIDRLEEAGHLRREAIPHDRRRVGIHIGDAARREAGDYFGSLQRRIDARTEALSADELDVVHRYLTGVIEAIHDHLADQAFHHQASQKRKVSR